MRFRTLPVLLSLLISSPIFAQDDSVRLSKVDWILVRNCVGGKMAESETGAPLREKKARGHFFTLDQRKAEIGCAQPPKQHMAWVKPISKDKAEITFLLEDPSGKLTMKRYEFEPKSAEADAVFEVPGTTQPCFSMGGSAVQNVVPKTNLTVKIDSWRLTHAPKEGPLAGQNRRYNIEAVAPESSAKKLELKETGLPSNHQLMKEFLQEFKATTATIPDRFNNLEDDLKDRAEACRKAGESLDDAVTSAAPLSLIHEKHAAQRSATDIYSIFVKAVPDHRTLRELQREIEKPEAYLAPVSETGVQ